MKNFFLLSFFFIAFSCTNAQKSAFSKEALQAKLISVDGEMIGFDAILEKYKGKPLLIKVWASWCGDCVKSIPKIKELQSNNPEIDYLFLSMDTTPNKWKKGIAKYQLKGEHFMAKDGMDGVFGKAIDLDWIPRYILLDKSGKILIYKAIESDFEALSNKIKEIEK